ncbi:MAG: hypothetical protein L0H93_11265 [Nocardioides sp.]|nr:hypothetical protein [Nocardioides sp.]
MRSLSVRHRTVAAACLLVCATVLSACNDDDSEGDPDSGESAQGTGTSPADLSEEELWNYAPEVSSQSVLVDGEVMVFGAIEPQPDSVPLDVDVQFKINRLLPYINVDDLEEAGVETELDPETVHVVPDRLTPVVLTHTPGSLTDADSDREYVFASEDEVVDMKVSEEPAVPLAVDPVEDQGLEPSGPSRESYVRYTASFELPYEASGTVLCFDDRDDLIGGGEVGGSVSGAIEVDIVTEPEGDVFHDGPPAACRFYPIEVAGD